MSDTDTEDDQTREFARALFAPTDETGTPEPTDDDDHKAARLIFNPTEGR